LSHQASSGARRETLRRVGYLLRPFHHPPTWQAPDLSRVIVVEDNKDLREEIVFHLRHAGHEAVEAGDGRALDAALATGPKPEVVVLDIGLPGEDGFSIATRLRRDHPCIGIVMLTARGLIDDKLQGLSLGADAYLVKPVDL